MHFKPGAPTRVAALVLSAALLIPSTSFAQTGNDDIAVSAGGELLAQTAKGQPIDAGAAFDAGVGNGIGLGAGALVAPLAKAAASTTIPANPGFQVTSLRGRTFTVGATQASTTVSEGMKQGVQDFAGQVGAALVEQQK